MDAMEQIYKQHAKTVYGFLLSKTRNSDLAEELTQETFFQAVKCIDKFKGDCSMSTWLCAIAKNLYFQYEKKLTKERSLAEDAAEAESASFFDEPPPGWDQIETLKAIHELKEPMREKEELFLTKNRVSFKADGTMIYDYSRRLYALRNPYIGDMPANEKIVKTLIHAEQYAEYDYELQTEKEPYRLTLNFKTFIPGEDSFNREITAYGCIMLALIENADEIAWTYPPASAPPGSKERRTKVLTTEEASEILGKNVKVFSKSPETIQELCDFLLNYSL